jgi:hypothetical protein
VLGSSDSKGAFPLESPVTPQDVLCTMYRHLGIDTEREYVDTAGRPVRALGAGRFLGELT